MEAGFTHSASLHLSLGEKRRKKKKGIDFLLRSRQGEKEVIELLGGRLIAIDDQPGQEKGGGERFRALPASDPLGAQDRSLSFEHSPSSSRAFTGTPLRRKKKKGLIKKSA